MPFAGSSNSSVGHWEDLWGEVGEMGVSEAEKGKLITRILKYRKSSLPG